MGFLGHPIVLWATWVLATALTSAVGRVGVPTLQNLFPGDNLPVDPLITGLLVGLAQWLVLRVLLPVSPAWSVATGLWILAELSVFAFSIPGAFLGGLVVGTGQWLVLRARLPDAGMWVLITALAWGFGSILASGLNLRLVVGYTGQYVLFHALIAGLSGIGLVWLLSGNWAVAG